MPTRRSVPRSALPYSVDNKIRKCNQTRGAGDASLFQNRVSRNGVVVIPREFWDLLKNPADEVGRWEKGFIVAVDPEWYFENNQEAEQWLVENQLVLGENAVLAFVRRSDWSTYANGGQLEFLPDGSPFMPVQKRSPKIRELGGNFIARVSAGVAEDTLEANKGLNTGQGKGLGIRPMEYASKSTLEEVSVQLEYLFWQSENVDAALAEYMTSEQIEGRRRVNESDARKRELDNMNLLYEIRACDSSGRLVCPLCLKLLSLDDFMSKNTQAQGREIHNLTSTAVTLFHIKELETGKIMHKPYNLGWGHDHCNMVVRDQGIPKTLRWMNEVVDNNEQLRGGMEISAESVEEAVLKGK